MKVGIVGGSGLYQIGEENNIDRVNISTPFGEPSSPISILSTPQNELFFLARHGEGHRILPTEVNYRANIFALKKVGVTHVVSVSAVGSLREEIRPGDFVLPAQYIDFTRNNRPNTFFGDGVAAHAPFSNPSCESLRNHLLSIVDEAEIRSHVGGTYVCIEGPQFSTRAESELFRSWSRGVDNGIHIVGMTAMPEARLAREAGLCYQTLGLVTDYDSWYQGNEGNVVDSIMEVLKANVERTRRLIASVAAASFPRCENGCAQLMRSAVVTPKALWPENVRERLELLLEY